jgi:mannose-6-phosphate isomerase-like protein (cupin superfamily)
MPVLIERPIAIQCAGTKPKVIEEYVGRANTSEARLSIAHMKSPGGWNEPGQRPEFDEFTLVLSGTLVVEHESGRLEVRAGNCVHTRSGEWIRYSTPTDEGAEYLAVCLPAFSPDTVHRDET